MNIQAISTSKFNNVQTFTGDKKNTPQTTHSSTPVAVKIPLATLIAMSPIMASQTNAQTNDPQQIVLTAHKDSTKLDPKTKILNVKTFFDINGQNYIVKTKSTDGDDSNFESITVSQATPNSRGSHYKANSIEQYSYIPVDDAFSDNGAINLEGINVEDTDAEQFLIGNEEFIDYFKNLAFSPENNGAIDLGLTIAPIKTIPTGRITHNLDGNLWEDAEEYCPQGSYLGEKKLETEHGNYAIAIYNSDEQNLTAEEFTLQKDFLPELKIDKMIKLKAHFITDQKEPITYETYQFNLRDNNGATTIIYDKTLGEYMEKVCKCPLYSKKQVPFEKAEVEKDYQISAKDGRIYLNKK